MTLIDLLVLVVVAAICGSIGQALAGYSVGGCLLSAVVGFIGAFVGVWLAQQLGLPEIFALNIGGNSFPIVWSIVGSAVLSLILGLFSRRRVLA